jgi:O-antigen ligase
MSARTPETALDRPRSSHAGGPFAPTASTLHTAAWCGLILAIAFMSALAVSPPPVAIVSIGGIGLLGVAGLALLRYNAAVFLGCALLGVVFAEPAPSDLIFCAVMIVAFATGRHKFDQLPVVIGGLLSLFVVVNLISFFEITDASRAVRFVMITVYLVAFSVWLTGYARSREHVRIIVTGYMAAAITASTAASLALFVSFPGSDHFIYEGGRRAQALFKDPNVFGPFLVPALLIMIEEMLSPRLFQIRRSTALCAIGALAVGILLSYSRGAWLNAVTAVTVLVIVNLLRRRGVRTAVPLISVLAVAGMMLLSIVALTGSASFLQERAHAHQAYDTDRFAAQRAGLALAENHLAGVGPGQFDLHETTASHSLYVRVLAEQGVLGFVTVLLLVTVTLLLALRNTSFGLDTYGLGSATLLAAWCGILANSVVVDTLHWRHLWLVAALIWVGASRARPTETDSSYSSTRIESLA